jgi:response regulator NasT
MVGGAKFYEVGNALPKPMRSILDVVEAQSRLESTRVGLAERKTIERAKGLLMRSRRLSEEDAYACCGR